MWSFISGFYNLIWCFQGSLVLKYVSHFICLWLKNSIIEITVWIDTILFTHLSVDGHVHLLAIMNNAVINIDIQSSGWTYVFISLGYIHLGTAGLYGDSILNCLRNCQNVFQNGYTMSYFHQQCSNFSTSSTIWLSPFF